MIEDKAWYQSKTVWGGLVALVGAAAGLIGIQIDAATNEALVLSLTSGASAVGAILAIYGRLSAEVRLR